MLYTVLFFPKNDIYEVRCGRVSDRLSLSETIVVFGVCACKQSGKKSNMKKNFFMIILFETTNIYWTLTNFNICTPFLER